MTAFSRKTLSLAVLMACFMVSYASGEEHPPRKEKRRDFNNMLTVGVGTLQFSNYNGIMVPAEIQFRRSVKKNLSWSIISQYFYGFDEYSTHGYDMDCGSYVRQHIGIMAGRVHYSFPVIGKWLYLTMGAGLGLGYHYFPDRDDDNRDIGNKIIPYATAEVQWEFRPGRRGVIRISPLIFSPSRVYVSPGRLNSPLDRLFCMFDIIHLSYGVRF